MYTVELQWLEHLCDHVPYEVVLDMGSLSHSSLIIAACQEAMGIIKNLFSLLLKRVC